MHAEKKKIKPHKAGKCSAACPVKWVSRKNYCFLNTTGSKLSLGEQIYFLEPASKIWKNKRKVKTLQCLVLPADREHSKVMRSEKEHVLKSSETLVTTGIRKGQESQVWEATEQAPAC